MSALKFAGALAALCAAARASDQAPHGLRFEPMAGETGPAVRFLSRGPGHAVLLNAAGAAFRTDAVAWRMEFIGANPLAEAVVLDPVEASNNYLIGAPGNWRIGVQVHGRVKYRNIYPGVDIEYYGDEQHLQYDLVFGPGAEPTQVRIRFQGAEQIRLDANGDLYVSTSQGRLRHTAPQAYQVGNGTRRKIRGRFVAAGPDEVTLEVGTHDRLRPLALTYSTYLGGSGQDAAAAIAVDAAGNAYITGWTVSLDFPEASGMKLGSPSGVDVYVAKLTPAGQLCYLTYLGGSGDDRGYGIAVDNSGSAIVAGWTYSLDFPILNAAQPTPGGGRDGFVAKLNPTGTALLFSTYLGGSGSDNVNGIAVDPSGNIYVAGETTSSNFPVLNAFQAKLAGGEDAFIAKFSAAGAQVYGTYLGGIGDDRATAVAVDASGNAYITGSTYSRNFPVANAFQPALGGGQDAFAAKIGPSGNTLVYSTYLGGNGGSVGNPETGAGIAVDSAGCAYIAGSTSSANFPTVNPFQSSLAGSEDAFVLKLNAMGNALVYSTYLGGSSIDFATAIAIDSTGRAYVAGYTASTDFPIANAVQTQNAGGYDAFLARLSASGSILEMSTYLGGMESDSISGVALDAAGNAYLAGQTMSGDFPTSAAMQVYKLAAGSGFVGEMPSASSAPSAPNLAVGKVATQSSTAYGALASLAVDGNTDGSFFHGSVTHTNSDTYAWWQVDLGAAATIDSIVIWNRTDCCSNRLSNYWVFVSNAPFAATDTPTMLQGRAGIWSSYQTSPPVPSTSLAAGGVQGRYIRVQLAGTNNLSLAEVQVLGTWLNVGSSSNLAIGKAATQSSNLLGPNAAAAVDGNTDGNFSDGSVSHTNQDAYAWWQVDLGSTATINSIAIWNRTDCCGDRLTNYWVFVSNTLFTSSDTPATLQSRAGTWSNYQVGAPNPSTAITLGGVQGRYIRIQLAGTNYLSLAEMQVLGTWATIGSNLAAGKTAAQSSNLSSSNAGAAVDGNPDGNYFDGSVSHTNLDAYAWWQVDLGSTATINSIAIWNRTDCCGDRLSNYWVFVSNTPFASTDTPATLQNRAGTWSSYQVVAPNPSSTIPVGGVQGRYIRIQLAGTNYLSLAEVQVMGS